jgi:hypothetical protein
MYFWFPSCPVVMSLILTEYMLNNAQRQHESQGMNELRSAMAIIFTLQHVKLMVFVGDSMYAGLHHAKRFGVQIAYGAPTSPDMILWVLYLFA